MSHAPSNAPERTHPACITYRIENALIVVTGEGFVNSAVLEAELPAIADVIRQPDRAWRVLLDVTHLRLTGGTQSLGVLSQFLKGNRPYIYRTAIIGLGSSTRRFLLNRSAALARRNNIQAFEERVAALAWLWDGEVAGKAED